MPREFTAKEARMLAGWRMRERRRRRARLIHALTFPLRFIERAGRAWKVLIGEEE